MPYPIDACTCAKGTCWPGEAQAGCFTSTAVGLAQRRGTSSPYMATCRVALAGTPPDRLHSADIHNIHKQCFVSLFRGFIVRLLLGVM